MPIVLHKDAAESYWYNLSGDAPAVFAVCNENEEADANAAPLVLWALPEERTGGRLRLNSFCGINLAGYRLTREGRRYRFVYRHPDHEEVTGELRDALESPPAPLPDIGEPPEPVNVGEAAKSVRNRLSRRI